MPNFNYHQALTKQQQQAIFHSDLQCYVNYMHQFILDDVTKYEPLMFIFNYGMPGKFPEGRWGFTFHGDVGIMQRPIVRKGGHRISPRHREMERYHLEIGSLFRIIAPITDYYEYHFQILAEPNEVIKMHLAALSRCIPLYHKYIIYKIFAGTDYKAKNTFLKSWFETYIEPSDGETNGYPFCLSDGAGEVNLDPVIKPSKVKTNELKKRLDGFAAAIRNENRKIEVDPTTDPLNKTTWVKQNLIPENQKTYSLFNKVCDITAEIVRDGKFPDKKYMHKDIAAEWYKWDTADTSRHVEKAVKFKNGKGEEIDWDTWETPIRDASELVVLFPKRAWNKLLLNARMSMPVTSFIDPSLVSGTFIPHDIIDDKEAIIMHRDLFQAWILPTSVRYRKEPYKNICEQTTDHIHAFDHSLDLLPFHSNIWLKLKDA